MNFLHPWSRHYLSPFLTFPLQDTGGDSALVWAVDKNQGRVVDLLVEHSKLELSQKHLAAVISHLTQSGVNNLGDVGLAVTSALDTLRPKVGLWLLRQKLQDLEEAGNYKALIEKILATAVRRGAVAAVEFLVTNSSVDVNILDQNEPLLIIAADMNPSSSTILKKSLTSAPAKKKAKTVYRISAEWKEMFQKDEQNVKIWKDVEEKEVANKKELTDYIEELFNCIICQVGSELLIFAEFFGN